MVRKRMTPWLVAGTLAVSAAVPVATRAIDLKDVVVGGGIAVAVNQFGGEINDFVNRISGTRGRAAQATKVVPIITAGKGVYVGAVQVTGPEAAVERVRAVAQVEGSFSRARVKVLIPVDTLNPVASPSRVQNVGVSALVDLRL